MTGNNGPSYRLATAQLASLAQQVTSTGTITSVNQATLAFPVAGRVSAVRVRIGQHVSAGQTVATLDTTSLRQQVDSASAALASAEQQLARDQDAQTSGSAASSSATAAPKATSAPSSSSAPPSSATAASLGRFIAAVQQAQRAVIGDQHAIDLDADLAAADRAVVAEDAACAAVLDATPAPMTTASSQASETGNDLQNCQDAIAAVQAAQRTVQADENRLVADEKALDRAVSALLEAVRGSGSAPNAGTTHPPAATRSATATRTAAASSSAAAGNGSIAQSTVVTAEQLGADQKQIDAAEAQLVVAKQNFARATLTTPIAGTVAAVSVSTGQTVSAASSSATIVVIGAGQKAVTTTVGINDIDLVKTGERAHVTVDGVTTPLSGLVTFVGVMNTSGTSGTTATYPVTVVLDPTTTPLYDGAGVSVAIDVASASRVLTVPTSAVRRIGELAFVSVYRGGHVTRTPVTLGVEGADRVQVKSGLTAGQQVELADLGASVPSNSSLTNRRGNNPFGGAQRVFVGGGPGGR